MAQLIQLLQLVKNFMQNRNTVWEHEDIPEHNILDLISIEVKRILAFSVQEVASVIKGSCGDRPEKHHALLDVKTASVRLSFFNSVEWINVTWLSWINTFRQFMTFYFLSKQTETHTLLSLMPLEFPVAALHWWDRSKKWPSWWAAGRLAQERRASAASIWPLHCVYKHRACILQNWRVREGEHHMKLSQ